jgi:prolipoprotein diacylglyceryltransferase
MEFSLLGAVVVAYVAMTIAANRLQPENGPKVADVLLGAAMMALFTGRVWYMLGTNTNPLTHLGDFILVRAGVSTVGATVGFVAVIVWQFRKNTAFGTALVAVPGLIGLAGWEIGCLVRGTCLGTEASIGLTSAGGITRHPIGIYTGLIFLLAAVVVHRLQSDRLSPWTGPLAFALAAFSRAVTEPFRLHFGTGMLWWYISAVALGLIGVAVTRSQKFSSPDRDTHN